MLADAIVQVSHSIDYAQIFCTIGLLVCIILVCVMIAGFFYIWTTVSDIESKVDDVLEAVNDDEDETPKTQKEKTNE